MKSLGRYECSLGHKARGLWLALALLSAGGCEGEGNSDTCQPYGCVNDVHLDGSLILATDVTDIDLQLCLEGEDACRTKSFDLKTLGDGTCLRWDDGSKVCLAKAETSDTFRLTSAVIYDTHGEPRDVTVEILISDQTSGDVLLDQTRSAKSRVTREDSCHRCWTAEASL